MGASRWDRNRTLALATPYLDATGLAPSLRGSVDVDVVFVGDREVTMMMRNPFGRMGSFVIGFCRDTSP
jgi:hypothetical protein